MSEKVYKTMKSAGITNLVLGILLMVISCVCGTFFIINGAKLLKKKSDLLF